MTEYIFREVHYGYADGTALGRTLEKQEEIVRCRDCDHGLFNGKTCDRLDPGFDEYWFEVTPDGYCAWAERRTNDNQ